MTTTTTTTRRHQPVSPQDVPEPVTLGWIGLFIPFVIVMAAVLLFGTRSPSQIGLTLALLAVPFAILLMRRSSHRTPRAPLI